MAYMTPHMATVSNKLWEVTSAVGAALCLPVLVVIVIVATHPESRAYLDRVSFRIVTASLASSMVFEIANTVGGTMTGPGFGCGFSVWILQLTLQISSWLLFCIALNLQLVVVHGFNGKMLEKYYFIGSIIAAILLTVPPYAAGQYGWDLIEDDCWYTATDKNKRIIVQFVTQLVWIALLAIGEVITSSAVIYFLMKHSVRSRFLHKHEPSFTTRSGTEMSGEDTRPVKANAAQIAHAKKYKSIIIRVALYPLASCIFSFLSILPAINSDLTDGINDSKDYNLLLMSDVVYGIRAIIYVVLVASDPALIRAVKTYCEHVIPGIVFWRQDFMKDGSITSQLDSKHPHLVVRIELSTIREREPTDAIDAGVGPHAELANETEDVSDGFNKNGSKAGNYEVQLDKLSTQRASPDVARSMEEGLAFQAQRRHQARVGQQDDFKNQI